MNPNVEFSYFLPPITNTTAQKEISLVSVYVLVKTSIFEKLTERVRGGKASKAEVLPFITPSGIFQRRRLADLISYSPIICIDLDHCDIGLKATLANDTFLRPALIFVSPSGTGLKVFIQIENARKEDHVAHFNAIAYYLRQTYGLDVDQACKDLPRACFLTFDPLAFFAYQSIESQALLNILPPADSAVASADNECNGSLAPNHKSPFVTHNTPSEKLNRLPEVHLRAISALKKAGWTRFGPRWTRPGKWHAMGTSALYNFYDKEGLYIFTNFSKNGYPFDVKGYTDAGVICELEFGGNFDECIRTLAREYLNTQ